MFASALTSIEADVLKKKLEGAITVSELYDSITKGVKLPIETRIYKRNHNDETYHLLVNGKIVRTRYNIEDINACYNQYVGWFSKSKFPAKIVRMAERTSHLRNYCHDEDFLRKNLPEPVPVDDDSVVGDNSSVYNRDDFVNIENFLAHIATEDNVDMDDVYRLLQNIRVDDGADSDTDDNGTISDVDNNEFSADEITYEERIIENAFLLMDLDEEYQKIKEVLGEQ